MLLSVTTTHRPAADLGYLLHKHPDRAQRFDVSTGTAHVFYPEVSEERTTATLLLEVDPVGLVRKGGNTLGQYVNDRPYAASSLLSVAIGKVFGTAMRGRCDARPELAATPIPLELHLPACPRTYAARLFEPLGWTVEAVPVPLDPVFPDWGDSPYTDLRLSGTLRLADALTQLYVLLPVLDNAKHYWVAADEVDKLLRAGKNWMVTHPDRELITTRYLAHKRRYTAEALARLTELDDRPAEDADEPEQPERLPSLAQLRREAIVNELRDLGVHRVVDLGCGEGRLLRELVTEPAFTEIVGVDVAPRVLAVAASRVDRFADRQRARVTLHQGSVTYADPRIAGFDADRAVRGHRAPGPATPTGTGGHGVRRGQTRTRAGDHPQRRVQRTLGNPAGRPRPPPGPPFRVDPHGNGHVGERRVHDTWLPGPPRPGRRGGPGGRRTDADGRLHEKGGLMTHTIAIPDLSLVALVGVTGSGKSTFARAHFAATQVLSSDAFRAMVADDENDQSATPDAFDALHYVAGKRLRAGRLTVVDATHVQREDRAKLVELARAHDVLPVAVVFDVPLATLRERNQNHRRLGDHVLRRQHDSLRRSIRHLAKEGFRKVHVLSIVDQLEIEYEKAYNDKRELTGPFDIIGDVHGCHRELVTLLTRLGYTVTDDGAHHPDGRTAVFVGDLVDRGPGHAWCPAPGDGHGRGRHRTVRVGQPREQARPRAGRPQREGVPRTGGVAGTAVAGAGGVPQGRHASSCTAS